MGEALMPRRGGGINSNKYYWIATPIFDDIDYLGAFDWKDVCPTPNNNDGVLNFRLHPQGIMPSMTYYYTSTSADAGGPPDVNTGLYGYYIYEDAQHAKYVGWIPYQGGIIEINNNTMLVGFTGKIGLCIKDAPLYSAYMRADYQKSSIISDVDINAYPYNGMQDGVYYELLDMSSLT